MLTDPIADMLTRIRNASRVGFAELEIPYSGFKFNVAKILEKEKYVKLVKETSQSGRKYLVLELAYQNGRPAISQLKRVSRPSQRIYAKKVDLPHILNDYGLAIISTPEGLMTNKEAKKKGLGGEIVCEVY